MGSSAAIAGPAPSRPGAQGSGSGCQLRPPSWVAIRREPPGDAPADPATKASVALTLTISAAGPSIPGSAAGGAQLRPSSAEVSRRTAQDAEPGQPCSAHTEAPTGATATTSAGSPVSLQVRPPSTLA